VNNFFRSVRRRGEVLTALATFVIGAIGVVLVLTLPPEGLAQRQPETGLGEVGPGAARASGRERFRPTYLPPGLEYRRSERQDIGNTDKNVFYLSFYDDGTTLAAHDEAGPRREILVNVTEGGPAPTDADFEYMAAADPTAERVTIRGHPGVMLRWTERGTAVKWRERDDMSIFVNGRGLGEDELLRVANGLLPN
jgi:hypothetical protein